MEPYAGDAARRMLVVSDHYDEAGAELVVDEVLDRLSLDDALTLVLMPFLREVGDRWEAGLLSVTQEHFASHLVRSRIAALAARGGPADDRPTAVVACPPGERHDTAPLAFSILLRREGLPVLYLGADTPMTDLAHACVRIQPAFVVVAATRATALLGAARELRRIAVRHPVAIAGAGASRDLADDIGADGSPATSPRAPGPRSRCYANRPADRPSGGQLSADSGAPGLQRASTICRSVTTGRHGSMFHEDLFGSTSRANVQWHSNCARIPGWSASGASRSTSSHASSSSSAPWAARPDGVGKIWRLRPPEPRTHWTRATNGGTAVGVADVDDVRGAVVVEVGVLGEGLGDVVADVVAGPADAAGSAEQPERAATTTAARRAPVAATPISERRVIRCAAMAISPPGNGARVRSRR